MGTSQARCTWMRHRKHGVLAMSHPSTQCLRCLIQVHHACDVSSKYTVLAMSHPSTPFLRSLIQVHRACDVSSKYTVLAISHPSTPCLRCLIQVHRACDEILQARCTWMRHRKHGAH